MPRARKGDKFFLQSKAKSGPFKGKYLLGLRRAESATLEDLLSFLQEKGIEPNKVEIPFTLFTTRAD